ncbi:MAG: HPF/RaiA family ribosome-associated protein [Phycisphaerales bacterium]|nr:HPF/RaiA family ribosome-associated protein [Phycisphaerales bacterium]
MMNIQIQTVHFDADSKLLDHVNKRIDKLKTFHDNILDVEVYLKIDNVVHQVKDKIAEIKVMIPKHTFFVKHESKVFEESFDVAFDALVNQIKKRKEKISA